MTVLTYQWFTTYIPSISLFCFHPWHYPHCFSEWLTLCILAMGQWYYWYCSLPHDCFDEWCRSVHKWCHTPQSCRLYLGQCHWDPERKQSPSEWPEWWKFDGGRSSIKFVTFPGVSVLIWRHIACTDVEFISRISATQQTLNEQLCSWGVLW